MARFDMSQEANCVFVKPGEIFLTSRPLTIITVLGSCVGTIFYCRRTGLAALSHAMYPKYDASQDLQMPFFVDTALLLMLRGFENHGIIPSEISAFIFGGAPVIQETGATSTAIGPRNHQAAIEALRRLKVCLVHCEPPSQSALRLTLDLKNYRIVHTALDAGKAVS